MRNLNAMTTILDEHGQEPQTRSVSLRRRVLMRLLETLIVAGILAVLALLIQPRLTNAAELGRDRAFQAEVRQLRQQVMLYRAMHLGMAPGYANGDQAATPTLTDFVAQMTFPTNRSGQILDRQSALAPLGPYMTRMPINPINHSSEIRFVPAHVPFPDAPQGPEGWLYQPATGLIAANVPGEDGRGVAYFDY
ncbi:MAG: hypothetical protein WD042_17970 [Phycisphaeraceae bacterium]